MALEDAKHDVDGAFTRRDLRGLSSENTFGGATSFLRRRYTKDLAGVNIAITGVPFDQAVTNRPGSPEVCHEIGCHARSSVGVDGLVDRQPVEIEGTFLIRE